MPFRLCFSFFSKNARNFEGYIEKITFYLMNRVYNKMAPKTKYEISVMAEDRILMYWYHLDNNTACSWTWRFAETLRTKMTMFFRYQKVLRYISLKGALKNMWYMHMHTCDCIALMNLPSESVRISSLPEKISSTRNKSACRALVAAPYLTSMRQKRQRPTPMYKYLSCPQKPEQPLR